MLGMSLSARDPVPTFGSRMAPLITVWMVVPTKGDCLFAPILCLVWRGIGQWEGSKDTALRIGIFSDAAISMKSGPFETLQHMVMRRLRAELRGEPLGV
jgi:hypothetical protein